MAVLDRDGEMGSSNEGSAVSSSAQNRRTTALTEGIVRGRSSVLEALAVGRAGGEV